MDTTSVFNGYLQWVFENLKLRVNQSRPGYPRFMYIINYYNFIYIYIYMCVCVWTFRSNAFQRHQLRYSCLSVCLSKSKLWSIYLPLCPSTYGVLFPGELLMKFIPLGPARAEEPSLGRVANSLADRCLYKPLWSLFFLSGVKHGNLWKSHRLWMVCHFLASI